MRAPFRLCREALKHVGKGGSFVFIGSTWGLYGTPGGGAYSVVKSGQIGLTQTMAAEYGAQGIRTNYVAPSVVRTEMTDAFWDLDFFKRTNHELTPIDREATTDDGWPHRRTHTVFEDSVEAPGIASSTTSSSCSLRRCESTERAAGLWSSLRTSA